jgi:hypothetical protein
MLVMMGLICSSEMQEPLLCSSSGNSHQGGLHMVMGSIEIKGRSCVEYRSVVLVRLDLVSLHGIR